MCEYLIASANADVPNAGAKACGAMMAVESMPWIVATASGDGERSDEIKNMATRQMHYE